MATTVVSLPAPHYPAWGSIECQGPHLLLPLTLNSESPGTPNTTEHDPLARFPKLLRTSLCWNPASFSNTAPEYIVHLDADEIESIYETVASFKALSLPDIASICPDNFHLPTELATKLRGLSRTVHNGRGFAVLRGLDPQGRADEDNVIAFAGIGSYIGLNRYASSDGKAMDHLRDAVKDAKPTGREDAVLHPSKMMVPLKFHADRKFADILGLFVKSKAAAGGEQYLSSFWTVYNQMMKMCPDALRVLASDFPWPGNADAPETTHSPVIFHESGRVLCQVVYRVFEGTNLLSPRQWQALDALETIANENAIQLDAQAGDIQLINNLALLHARRSWVDRPGQERHYYRLGLHDPKNSWKRPGGYEEIFDEHIRTPSTEQTIPVTDFDPYGMTRLGDGQHG